MFDREQYLREYNKNRYEVRKRNGLCINCAVPLSEGAKRVRCDVCNAKALEVVKKCIEKKKIDLLRQIRRAVNSLPEG